MKYKILLFVQFINLFNYNLEERTFIEFKTDEIFKNEISSVFTVQNDTTFRIRYDKILRKYEKKDYVTALNESLNLYDDLNGNTNEITFYDNTLLIGDIYKKVNKLEKALKYYKIGLNTLVTSNIQEKTLKNYKYVKLAKSYLRIGSTFQKLSKLDSAKYYFNKLEKIPSLNVEILNYKAISYGNLIGIYELDSLYDKAILFAKKSIDIHLKTNDKIGLANTNINLGNIYLHLKKFTKSKETYIKGINSIQNDNSQVAVKLKADLYYNLAWAMRNLEDYKAYDYQEMSYDIENGLRDKEIRRMVEEVSAKYNVKDIKREEENKRLKDQRTFWLFGIGSFIVMISLLYFLNLYKLKQKNLRLKLSQTQLIQNQNIEKLKSESQARILNATIDGKETERKEIAETLHDSVSALLSSANLHLMATKPLFKGDIPLEIDKNTKHYCRSISKN